MMPEGIETMIAIEKPKAMITKNALIFLLEMFLTALVETPKWFTFVYTPHLIQKVGSGKQSILASSYLDLDYEPCDFSLLPSPFVAMSFQEQWVIKLFFRIIPKSFLIKCMHSSIMPEHTKSDPAQKKVNDRLSLPQLLLPMMASTVYLCPLLPSP